MSKNNKQDKKELARQAEVQNILNKIEAQRDEGTFVAGEDPRENIREAKQKLAEAYKKLAAENAEREAEARKRELEKNCTYSEEEKQRILQNCRNVTDRYMKLKDFVEDYERMQVQLKIAEMIKAQRENAGAEDQPQDAKEDEE